MSFNLVDRTFSVFLVSFYKPIIFLFVFYFLNYDLVLNSIHPSIMAIAIKILFHYLIVVYQFILAIFSQSFFVYF